MLMEIVFNVHLDLLLVPQQLMELLAYLDSSCQLHGPTVLDVHLQLPPVLQLLLTNHVYLLSMLPLLQDLMLLVQPVQLLEML